MSKYEFHDPVEQFKKSPVLFGILGLYVFWHLGVLLIHFQFIKFVLWIGSLGLIFVLFFRKSSDEDNKNSLPLMKKIVLFMMVGLLGLWILGIILVNFFDVDMDRVGNLFNSSFFLEAFIAVGGAILFFFSISLVRRGAEKTREKLTDDERLSGIRRNFVLGVTLPILLTFISVFAAAVLNLRNRFSPQYDPYFIFGGGTLLSLSGLPFIIRTLRLIRNEVKAGWAAVFLAPYGIALWLACILLMMMIFSRGSCC